MENIKKPPVILGVETSCDDTAIGIVCGNKILSNVKIDQAKISKLYGGIVPEVAARNHLEQIEHVFKLALENANLQVEHMDYFAATAGPGLAPALVVGYYFTKTLAAITHKPFIPIHHLDGHICAAVFNQNMTYPYLALIISGGHSEVYLCSKPYEYQLVINSLDDAAGEVFDKVGRVLNMPFPAGPSMEKLAQQVTEFFPPCIPAKNLMSFSFSGLKTRCLNMLETTTPANVAYFLQNSIGLTLKHKLQQAIQTTNVKQIVVAGGVAANQHIRQLLQEFNPVFPPLDLCMDNGAMIAISAQQYLTRSINMEVFPRMSLDAFSKLWGNVNEG